MKTRQTSKVRVARMSHTQNKEEETMKPFTRIGIGLFVFAMMMLAILGRAEAAPVNQTIPAGPSCRINYRIPLSGNTSGLIVELNAEGMPGPEWRITRSLPFTVVYEGQLENGSLLEVLSFDWDRNYKLQVKTGPDRWFSSPGCQFRFERMAYLNDDQFRMTEGEIARFDFKANDIIPFEITGAMINAPEELDALILNPAFIEVRNPPPGDYEIIYQLSWNNNSGFAKIHLTVKEKEEADLSVELSAPRVVMLGDEFELQVTVLNNTPVVTNGSVTVSFPDGTDWNEVVDFTGVSARSFTLTRKVTETTTFTGTVVGELEDPRTDNNSDAVTVEVVARSSFFYLPFVGK